MGDLGAFARALAFALLDGASGLLYHERILSLLFLLKKPCRKDRRTAKQSYWTYCRCWCHFEMVLELRKEVIILRVENGLSGCSGCR